MIKILKKVLKNFKKKRDYSKVRDEFYRLINEGKINEIDQLLSQKLKDGYLETPLYRIVFSLLKNTYPEIAIKYGERVLEKEKNPKFMLVLANRYKWIGNLKRYKEIMKEIDRINLIEKGNYNLSHFIKDLKELISNSNKNEEEIKSFIKEYESYFFENMSFNKQIFIHLKDILPDIAIKYGLKYYQSNKKDYKFASVLALRLMRIEDYEKAYEIYYYLYNNDFQNREIYENKLLLLISLLNENKVVSLLKDKKYNEVLEYIYKFFPPKMKKNLIYKSLFLLLKDKSEFFREAIYFANKYLEDEKDSFVSLALSNLFFKQGQISNALNVKGLDFDDPKTKLKISHYKAYKKLLEEGFILPNYNKKKKINKIKIGYCLHNTLPYNSGGYATRSHGLAKGLQILGYDIQIISRLGYPKDLSSFKENEKKLPEIDVIEGIKYYRLFTDINKYGVVPLDLYLKEYGEAVYKLAKKLDLTILHGASNFMNGLAVNYAARKLGIKSVYEVRGLWEITRMSRQPEWEGSEHFNMIKRLETEAALNADAVITITEALKNEMIARGVPEEKITVVSNGVHTDRFVPKERVKDLESKLGFKNKIVIGFIGSIVNYEGLEYLVEASRILKNKNIKNFAVMIVGDGDVLDDIKYLAKKLDVDDIFTFTGRVPHEEVEDYYSLVDIAPFPRKGLPVCEMVSPIKPFEAMSMAKAVVASNVAALTEIVKNGQTGLLFQKDNPQDLARVLLQLINDKELREKLGRNARDWVVKEKDWKILAKKVGSIYENLRDKKT